MTKTGTVVATLLILVVGFAAQCLGQKVSCSCESAPGRTCRGIVNCPDGCTSLCGTGDNCYLACRTDYFEPRVTFKVSEKTAQEIAALLSSKIRKRIEFIPDMRKQTERFNLDVKNDDVFNVLNFLYKKGRVKFDGVDFGKLKELRKQVKQGRKVSTSFTGIPVKDVVAILAFTSGKRFRVTAGDPERIISISISEASLDEIIARVAATAGVKIKK